MNHRDNNNNYIRTQMHTHASTNPSLHNHPMHGVKRLLLKNENPYPNDYNILLAQKKILIYDLSTDGQWQ